MTNENFLPGIGDKRFPTIDLAGCRSSFHILVRVKNALRDSGWPPSRIALFAEYAGETEIRKHHRECEPPAVRQKLLAQVFSVAHVKY